MSLNFKTERFILFSYNYTRVQYSVEVGLGKMHTLPCPICWNRITIDVSGTAGGLVSL